MPIPPTKKLEHRPYKTLVERKKNSLLKKIREKARSIFATLQQGIKLVKSARKLMALKSEGHQESKYPVSPEHVFNSSFAIFVDCLKIFLYSMNNKVARKNLNALFENLNAIDYKKGSNTTIDHLLVKLRKNTRETLHSIVAQSADFSLKPLTFGLDIGAKVHKSRFIQNMKTANYAVTNQELSSAFKNEPIAQALQVIENISTSISLCLACISIVPSTKKVVHNLNSIQKVFAFQKNIEKIDSSALSEKTNTIIRSRLKKATNNIIVEKYASSFSNFIIWTMTALTIVSGLIGLLSGFGAIATPGTAFLFISVFGSILAIGSISGNFGRYIYKNFESIKIKLEIKNLLKLTSKLEKKAKQIYQKIQETCTNDSIKERQALSDFLNEKKGELEKIKNQIEIYKEATQQKRIQIEEEKQKRKTKINHESYQLLLKSISNDFYKPGFNDGLRSIIKKINPSIEKMSFATPEESCKQLINAIADRF